MDKADDRSVLARREFMKATGAILVGFSVRETASAQATGLAAAKRGVSSGPPDEAEIDSYIAVHPDNTVTIFSGYVDLGQGGPTALRQIAAEELDLDFDQVLTVRADT
jgi:nicotinate dehydrogenase subunit B